MQLLYTGAESPDTPQMKPELSLGGFVSNTVVNLSRANALFADLSYLAKVNKTPITRGFVLKNESTDDAIDVMVSYEYTNNGYKLEVAFVTLAEPDFNKMEQIGTQNDTPYYATFVEANTSTVPPVDNTVNVGNIMAGKTLGMWLRLTPNANAKTCEQLDTELTTPPTNTPVVLKVSFTPTTPTP